MNRRRISPLLFVLAVFFFAIDYFAPGAFFPVLGRAGALALYWILFALSLVFIVLFFAFRGRSS